MAGYKKILFPTDLSKDSKKIAEHVKLMAEKFGADITVIYVASIGHYYNTLDMPVAGLEHFETEVVAAASTQIKDFTESVFEGVDVKTVIMSGNPADEIVEYAEKNSIDLIIMGHSRAGLERMLLGSVAHRVLKFATVPVMVVRV
ncbi:MAG: universal stress protein [Deltaproteobacteria bacterium]|nr:universal stress protein [Deltaproteobacteria bacterium]